MTKSRLKLVLDDYGSYLGMEKGCFVVKDKQGCVERHPLFEKEIGEVILQSGNMVSTGALSSLGFWGIDVLIQTQRGRPVAMMKSLDDDSHVKTRLCQYEALNNGKGSYIAKQIVSSKLKSQNILLEKYNLDLIDEEAFQSKIEELKFSDLNSLRKKLTGIEGKFTEHYFKQIFELLPKKLMPEKRSKFKAYDGTNNIFNLAYEVLQWKVYRAIIKAKLEPYLGYLHSVQYGKPSLVCDLQELYRYLMDDFVIQFCRGLTKRDFTVKSENVSRTRKGKREYLNNDETKIMMGELETLFESKVDIPLIRHGKKQRIETLINEETLLLGKYLRDEITNWTPRITSV
jgi:CRISPR-associated protein Cas1